MKVDIAIGVTNDTHLLIDKFEDGMLLGMSEYDLRRTAHREYFRAFVILNWQHGFRWNGEPHPDVRQYVEDMYAQVSIKMQEGGGR